MRKIIILPITFNTPEITCLSPKWDFKGNHTICSPMLTHTHAHTHVCCTHAAAAGSGFCHLQTHYSLPGACPWGFAAACCQFLPPEISRSQE